VPLVLDRNPGGCIVLTTRNGVVKVYYEGHRSGGLAGSIAIEAPKSVGIYRAEIYDGTTPSCALCCDEGVVLAMPVEGAARRRVLPLKGDDGGVMVLCPSCKGQPFGHDPLWRPTVRGRATFCGRGCTVLVFDDQGSAVVQLDESTLPKRGQIIVAVTDLRRPPD